MKKLGQTVRTLVRSTGWDLVKHRSIPADIEPQIKELIKGVQPFTMTLPERLYGLIKAVDYLEEHKIHGDVVECGVWRGGSMMAAAQRLNEHSSYGRDLWLYDTFKGMAAPTEFDVNRAQVSASDRYRQFLDEAGESQWCRSDLEEVQANMKTVDYVGGVVHFVDGMVEDTIPSQMPDRIALLRLDTDLYESTKHELEHLFPRIVPYGVLLIDDYGWWQGARKAVDEYLAGVERPLLLQRLDHSCRIAVVPP